MANNKYKSHNLKYEVAGDQFFVQSVNRVYPLTYDFYLSFLGGGGG